MILAPEKTLIAGSVYRFDLETYNRMIDAGILTTRDKVELIRGEIVNVAAMGDKHIFWTGVYTSRLVQHYSDEAWILSQCPVQMLSDSEPEPDFALLKLPADQYEERKPQAEDVLLIIEVSNSSLAYDRSEKLSLYAEAGIPEVWIRNLQDDVLEVYREPMGDRYGFHSTLLPGEEATPLFSQTPFKWSRD